MTNLKKIAIELGYLQEADRFAGFADTPNQKKDYLVKGLDNIEKWFKKGYEADKVKKEDKILKIKITYSKKTDDFYGMYIYIGNKDKWTKKYSRLGDARKFVEKMGVNYKIPKQYNPRNPSKENKNQLDKIMASFRSMNIMGEYDNEFDQD